MCIVLVFGSWIIGRGIFMCIVLVFGSWIIERGIYICIVLVFGSCIIVYSKCCKQLQRFVLRLRAYVRNPIKCTCQFQV